MYCIVIKLLCDCCMTRCTNVADEAHEMEMADVK